jgi:hypothetical protein
MTRAERAALREQRLKDQLATASRQRAHLEAQERAAARTARARRHQRVGALADAAGLFVWDDTTLAQLFTLLRPLTQMPNPEAVLEALLADPQAGDAMPQGGASGLREDAVPCGGGGGSRGLRCKPA